MSTVTLSKPHCAITSAEKPDGIASQAFTTALPEAQTFLTLFVAIDRFPLCWSLQPDSIVTCWLCTCRSSSDVPAGCWLR